MIAILAAVGVVAYGKFVGDSQNTVALDAIKKVASITSVDNAFAQKGYSIDSTDYVAAAPKVSLSGQAGVATTGPSTDTAEFSVAAVNLPSLEIGSVVATLSGSGACVAALTNETDGLVITATSSLSPCTAVGMIPVLNDALAAGPGGVISDASPALTLSYQQSGSPAGDLILHLGSTSTIAATSTGGHGSKTFGAGPAAAPELLPFGSGLTFNEADGTIDFNDSAAGTPVQVAAYGYHTCALNTTNDVWCWGYNRYGQLGIPYAPGYSYGVSGSQATTPQQVNFPGTVTSVVSLENTGADLSSSCAITAPSNKVHCWGYGSLGNRGNGVVVTAGVRTNDTHIPSPVLQSAGVELTNVAELSTGGATPGGHHCAVKTDGTVWCWGNNTNGQLGNGTSVVQAYAVQVKRNAVTFLTGIEHVRAGNTRTCAWSSTNIYCWGNGALGMLGDGNAAAHSSLYAMIPSAAGIETTGVTDFALGPRYTCQVTSAGAVKCWGSDQYEVLGNGAGGDSLTAYTTISSGVVALAGGPLNLCATLDDNSMSCWGLAHDGLLGDGVLPASGTTLSTPTPAAPSLTGDIATNVMGGYENCVLTISSKLYCWGDNTWGNTGYIGGLNGQNAGITGAEQYMASPTRAAPGSVIYNMLTPSSITAHVTDEVGASEDATINVYID